MPRSILPGLALVGVFLVTRLLFIDGDLPPWDLAMYQPIDEGAYVYAAFNLHHFGTWSHQAAPYAPVDGGPMNVAQTALTAASLALSWTYWGLRLPSVLFAAIFFFAMVAVARRLVANSQAEGLRLPIPPRAILFGVIALLLVDFGSLVASRVVEPTIHRVAVVAFILWLVARGTLLGARHGVRTSIAFGLLAGAAATFGYIYSAFLVPTALVLCAWHGHRRGGAHGAARNLLAAAAGAGIAAGLYFAFVAAVYGQLPGDWYRVWVSTYRDTGRADGLDPSQLWDLLLGNTVRLNRTLMALALGVLPAFILWVKRTRDPLGVTVIAGFGMLALQSVLQSDYAPRKMLIAVPFLVVVVVAGMLRFSTLQDWLYERRRIRSAYYLWLAVVAAAALVMAASALVTLPAGLRHLIGYPSSVEVAWQGPAGALVLLGAVAGVVSVVILLVAWRSEPVARAAAAVMLCAALLPLTWLDLRHVYGNISFQFRDAMQAEAGTINGLATAGASSYAMQLYNTSRPVLEGYVYGMTREDYEKALVRYFSEGRAAFMYAYADGELRKHWESMGFRLEQQFEISLPKDHTLGRYVFEP